jgi:hypothetical protein
MDKHLYMFHQVHASVRKKFPNLSARTTAASFLVLLLLMSGCAGNKKPPEVELKINSVKPTGRPGVYTVDGTTNLPNSSQLSVAAIRYLRSANGEFIDNGDNNNYSILSRQMAEVTNGKWQTTLNIWQVAANGIYQEPWQLNRAVPGINLQPAQDVKFIATFDEASQSSTFKTPSLSFEGGLVRFTNDGQQFVQANQTVAVGVPTTKTAPPITRAEDVHDGWGDRSQLTPVAGSTGGSRIPAAPLEKSNVPLSPSEFLR